MPPNIRINPIPSSHLDGARVEHRVQIYVGQVVKVLQVARRHRVAGPVGVRESVQERLQGAFQELHEGLLGSVLARAAQHL